MKQTHYLVLFILLLVLASCTENPVLPTEEQIVVRGFLYANEPVEDIQIGSSLPIGSTDTLNPPISNAVVVLLKNGNPYTLRPSTTKSGYYFYPGSDLLVQSGDKFNIQIEHNNQVVTAETIVPEKPSNVSLSQDTIVFKSDTISTPFGSRSFLTSDDTVLVSWNNPNGDYYYTVVESVDPNRQSLQTDTVRRMVPLISQPTSLNHFRVPTMSLDYTGRYRMKLYHVNKEYADLYRSREQDSRSLNEPLTNVKNGLGVFSAFASDSVFFTVSKQ